MSHSTPGPRLGELGVPRPEASGFSRRGDGEGKPSLPPRKKGCRGRGSADVQELTGWCWEESSGFPRPPGPWVPTVPQAPADPRRPLVPSCLLHRPGAGAWSPERARDGGPGTQESIPAWRQRAAEPGWSHGPSCPLLAPRASADGARTVGPRGRGRESGAGLTLCATPPRLRLPCPARWEAAQGGT